MRRALAFLTPLGGARAPDREMVVWFPVVGAGVGAAVGAVWWLAAHVWPPVVAAAIAVAADLALTGMLHADGLIDAADGLLPHLRRERRLEVMAEPAVGAFGLAVGGGVLLLRFAALTSRPHVGLVAAVWCASRTVMAVATRAVPYARDGGLATPIVGGAWGGLAVAGVLASMAIALTGGVRAELAVLVCILGATAVVQFGRRKLGGFTGDVLGAAGVIGETVALLVWAAK